ncbi:MAG: ribonuclease HI [Desulfobacteraceae bacterium]|nr:ribonuclease HI [Desulfobacteraceae bacterium]MBC2754724.1 ribonuclease HI [Desulfobacteraceae bacterium]
MELKPEDYNWVRKRFKKNKVWMAFGKDGNPFIQKNKVLIKYQLDQKHEYWVKPESVYEIQPEDQKYEKSPAAQKFGRRPVKAEKNKPEIPPDEKKNVITIYTDGASSGNPGPSGIGVFMRYGNHKREISRYIGNSTNNIAELTAIETALLELKRTDLPIRIYTDSSYACGLLINGWKAKKNISLVNSIKKLMTKFKDLKIIKVKGHSGISGNEKADQLATAAITSQKDSSC